MTQQERQNQSREKIFEAAMAEFSSQEYENVTMDRICATHDISKGMMYHYYSNKDELFLLCVKDTFESLNHYIQENALKPDGQNTTKTIKDFFMLREQFMEIHPQYRRIFERAVFHPPVHLAEKIAVLHEEINQFNKEYLKEIVAYMPLRSGVKQESVIRMMEGIEFLMRSSGYRDFAGQDTEGLNLAIASIDEILDILFFGALKNQI